MNVRESVELKDFITNKIYSEFGKQPSSLRYWDKNALRVLYTDFLKPQYLFIRKNQKLRRIIEDVQKHLEYD